MRKLKLFYLAILLLIFLLISGIREVLAQGTITPEPIFKTPTTRPTDFYDCPQTGEMEGFGEKTPSVSWMMSCGLCLSTQMATVIPSQIPTLEGTPGTPDVTLTPTIEGQGEWEPGIYNIVFPGFGNRENESASSMTGYEVVPGNGNLVFYLSGDCFRDWFGDPVAIGCDVVCKGFVHDNQPNKVTRWEGWTFQATGNWSRVITANNFGSSLHPGELELMCMLNTGPWVPEYSGFEVSYVEGNNLYVVDGPIPDTPTPDPDNSYCGTIDIGNGGGSDPFNAEDVFTIPVPVLGQANCIVLMPAFTLPVTAINIIPGINIENDISFPGATLCVRALQLGILKILGMAIDLDFYAVLIGAMMILRKVLRS